MIQKYSTVTVVVSNGSDLVKLSTGIDFVQEIIKVSLGQKPALKAVANCAVAAVRFICTRKDLLC